MIRKERYIYLIYIFKFERFSKRVFTYMYIVERNIIMKTRPDTSPNLSWQAGVARGSFREFEMWVRVGKDEASLRTIVNFLSIIDKV